MSDSPSGTFPSVSFGPVHRSVSAGGRGARTGSESGPLAELSSGRPNRSPCPVHCTPADARGCGCAEQEHLSCGGCRSRTGARTHPPKTPEYTHRHVPTGVTGRRVRDSPSRPVSTSTTTTVRRDTSTTSEKPFVVTGGVPVRGTAGRRAPCLSDRAILTPRGPPSTDPSYRKVLEARSHLSSVRRNSPGGSSPRD